MKLRMIIVIVGLAVSTARFDEPNAWAQPSKLIGIEYEQSLLDNAAEAMEKGDYDGAIEWYSTFLNLNPKDSRTIYRLATAYWKAGELKKAVELHDRLLTLTPKFARAYYDRGFIHKQLGELEKAVADFTESIRLEPSYLSAYIQRGIIRYENGSVNEAHEDFDRAIEVGPRSALAYYVRASYYRREHKHEKAVADFTESIRLSSPRDPMCASAHNNLAWLLATCPEENWRDGNRAVILSNKACAFTDYSNANHLETLAAAYAEIGDFDAALRWIEKAVQLATEHQKEKYQGALKSIRSKKPIRD